MIDKALGFLLDELNRFLEPRSPGGEPLAVLSSLAVPHGGAAPGTDNKLVISLLSIEKEGAASSLPVPLRDPSAPAQAGAPSGFARVAAPLPLNLNVMVAASFGANYREALKVLSAAIGFFQARPGFTPQNAPALPPGIERLSIEMVSCDLTMLSNVWSVLGANYLPSALYKIRMLTVQQGWVAAFEPAVSGAATDLGTRS
ncbi:DUF4255 domain-containing protein [Paraburkholderia sp.]|jgi:Pvc16 N-terminal domain|uniref:DUF4255 domain-containing protein n=1 Tax=Paraburkholderia sp. TaxID=1926495 RepID=UPI000EFA412F|nr:DUF4255 domain-containing protein [Paraburkholderia sp.]